MQQKRRLLMQGTELMDIEKIESYFLSKVWSGNGCGWGGNKIWVEIHGASENESPTLPKTNIFAPKNGGFQQEFPFPRVYFQGLC